ncbi:high-potential iron-sulfur protein [Daejeonella sp. JGW-45]|uniref:high-potential iron-sulfur protein n=1 Tax=Daejeonella sp. JGW-45 TaxID=3034148 RepID=UPI0023ED9ADE|nr:high-potential iron-sulfur protein [Daejeonella sp. JGW-45]
MKEKKQYSRREFIGKYFYTGSLLLGGGILLSCTSVKSVAAGTPQPGSGENNQVRQDSIKKESDTDPKGQAVQEKNPCDDMTGVSAEELEKRKKLAYVNKTPIPDSHCSNCTLYIPPAKDKPCGGCMLFKGPVRKEGYCAYWAPITN